METSGLSGMMMAAASGYINPDNAATPYTATGSAATPPRDAP